MHGYILHDLLVFCSVHVCCLQLERFLCRECGKVKCSCNLATNGVQAEQSNSQLDNNLQAETAKDNKHELDDIEYRKPEFIRQNSRSDQSKSFQKPLPLSTQRTSDQPFERSHESGKLRRSFIVRSREGLENFLNFSSTRKGQEQNKEKQMLRQQF